MFFHSQDSFLSWVLLSNSYQCFFFFCHCFLLRKKNKAGLKPIFNVFARKQLATQYLSFLRFFIQEKHNFCFVYWEKLETLWWQKPMRFKTVLIVVGYPVCIFSRVNVCISIFCCKFVMSLVFINVLISLCWVFVTFSRLTLFGFFFKLWKAKCFSKILPLYQIYFFSVFLSFQNQTSNSWRHKFFY